jgi:hypothetical protein
MNRISTSPTPSTTTTKLTTPNSSKPVIFPTEFFLIHKRNR